MKTIYVDNISFGYDHNLLLSDIQLTMDQEDFIILNGPNGAGKTTLISLILGFIKPTQGSIFCSNGTIKNQVSYLPQKGFFHSVPMKSIDVVASSFVDSRSFFLRGSQQHKELSYSILEELGIKDLAYKEFSSLSGGQAQKVLLARVLVNPTNFIFLDEPFSHMDEESRNLMMSKLMELKGKSGILIISHDMDLIADHQGRFCYLKQGRLTSYKNISDMEHSFFHEHSHIHHFRES